MSGPAAEGAAALGRPRAHFRRTDSTNTRARVLAGAGAPHGTVVTAREQTAGRGRQGRAWVGPPGRALLVSVVLRGFDALLPLRTGLAVADVAGPEALVKWPNDVLVDGRKLAGVLVEGRVQEGWAVAGIGLNVAVEPAELPPDVRAIAATLGRPPEALEPTLAELLRALEARLAEPPEAVVASLRRRDALRGRRVRWAGGEGVGDGIDAAGRLVVRTASGRPTVLDAGEVHLGSGVGIASDVEPIVVRRHGQRWAVQEGRDATAVAEYGTRELAELAARQRGGGREVVVEADSGDAQLGTGGGLPRHGTAARGRGAAIDARMGAAGSGDDTPREPQAGL